jgi:hypothetical protein
LSELFELSEPHETAAHGRSLHGKDSGRRWF